MEPVGDGMLARGAGVVFLAVLVGASGGAINGRLEGEAGSLATGLLEARLGLRPVLATPAALGGALLAGLLFLMLIRLARQPGRAHATGPPGRRPLDPGAGPETIRLGDYMHDDRYFEFDPGTGRFESVRLATPRSGRGEYRGIAQRLRIKRHDVLVATYCQQGHAWLSIGARRWPLFAPDLEMTHEESRWGFTCRFSIRRDNELLFRLDYPRQDRLLMVIDSTYDHLDFSLMHLLVDVGDHRPASRAQDLASFLKHWCPESAARAGTPAEPPATSGVPVD